jgi:hypothetical protein
MFWRKKAQSSEGGSRGAVTYNEAKEATRRAAFLSLAAKMSPDEEYKQQLAELFRVCRSAAHSAGVAAGFSESEIDNEIGALCDADTARLQQASDSEFQSFTAESGQIVKAFLGKLNVK